MSMLPCAVRKTTGSRIPRFSISRKHSSPPIPGICTSSTTTPAREGITERRNSSASG